MRTLTKFLVYSILVVAGLIIRPVHGQEEIPVVKYNQVYTHQFDQGGEQYFAQFTGAKGDVVYLLAKYTDFVIGNIDIDLRDSVGRTVGIKNEYLYQKFVIGQLPSDGTYTVVITPEKPETVDFKVGLSGYLEDGVEATLEKDGFQTLFLIRGDRTGNYNLSYERRSGNLPTDFSIITFSEIFTESIIEVNGTSVNTWNANVMLTQGDTYVGFLDRNTFGDGDKATVYIKLSSS